MTNLECILVVAIIVLIITIVSSECRKKTENATGSALFDMARPAARVAPPAPPISAKPMPAMTYAPPPVKKSAPAPEPPKLITPITAAGFKSDLKLTGSIIKGWFK